MLVFKHFFTFFKAAVFHWGSEDFILFLFAIAWGTLAAPVFKPVFVPFNTALISYTVSQIQNVIYWSRNSLSKPKFSHLPLSIHTWSVFDLYDKIDLPKLYTYYLKLG
jgi:hypothetical protein